MNIARFERVDTGQGGMILLLLRTGDDDSPAVHESIEEIVREGDYFVIKSTFGQMKRIYCPQWEADNRAASEIYKRGRL